MVDIHDNVGRYDAARKKKQERERERETDVARKGRNG